MSWHPTEYDIYAADYAGLLVDRLNPVNENHPLARGLVSWNLLMPWNFDGHFNIGSYAIVPHELRALDLLRDQHLEAMTSQTAIKMEARSADNECPMRCSYYMSNVASAIPIYAWKTNTIYPKMTSNGEGTFSAWVKYPTNTNDNGFSGGDIGGGLSTQSFASHRNFSGAWYNGILRNSRPGHAFAGDELTQIPLDKWHMVTTVSGPSLHRWFRNDTVFYSHTAGSYGFPIDGVDTVGRANLATKASYYFVGNWQSIALWNRVLTDDEVALWYREGCNNYPGLLNRIDLSGFVAGAAGTPVSVTRVFLRQSLQELLNSRAYDMSWSGDTNFTRQKNVSWISDLSKTEQTPFSSALELEITRDIPFSYRGQLSPALLHNISYIADQNLTKSYNIQYVADLDLTSDINITYTNDITNDNVVNLAYSTEYDITRTSNIQFISDVSDLNVVNISYLLESAAFTREHNIQYLIDVDINTNTNVEYLTDKSITSTINFNNLLEISLNKGSIIQILSDILSQPILPITFTGSLDSSRTTNIEYLQDLTGQREINIEWQKTLAISLREFSLTYLSGLSKSANHNINYKQGISKSTTIPFAFISDLDLARQINVCFNQDLSLSRGKNISYTGGVSSQRIIDLQWGGGVLAVSLQREFNIEWPQSLSSARQINVHHKLDLSLTKSMGILNGQELSFSGDLVTQYLSGVSSNRLLNLLNVAALSLDRAIIIQYGGDSSSLDIYFVWYLCDRDFEWSHDGRTITWDINDRTFTWNNPDRSNIWILDTNINSWDMDDRQTTDPC